MIETVAAVNLMVEEVLKIKKNRLMPDFPKGNEKRLAVVSGIFGDELQGQYVCYELIRRIKEDFGSLTGIVDIYPSLNPLGLEARTREIPGPELEMNALFPGSHSGVMGEYAAYCVFQDLKGADICVDVHGSNMFLHEILQVRMNDDMVDELMPYARALNTDMIWIHPSNQVKSGSLAYELNQIGVKSFVIESSYAYKINQNYGNQLVDGIFALMKEMGIWQGETIIPREPLVTNDMEMAYINSESSGIFIPEVEVSSFVREGARIGSVVNVITGSVEEVVKAPKTGVISAMREYPAIEEGSLLARIVGAPGEER
ncbi:MAG: succinylglutamate desuccinylase/aspartoacylase family protein [Eubacterium sp.]|nr:succinylglutamate desuccinylase/aspartoacylase family protein [Eubacterium sp.]MBR6172152.1 succinylglutamate desuccinylase/aspartoacylase family protein [Eubacterium sp.]